MFNLLKLLSTKQPQKRFQIECQLMLRYANSNRYLRRFFQRRIYYKFHCEISHKAKIDKTAQFPHPIGIVIGSNSAIGSNTMIYQGVTVGATIGGNNEMPCIGHNCIIFAGAKLIGGISIGNNVVIGANSVVTKNIPDNCTVVGVNRIISK